jgi:hypothetical protein
MLIEQFQIGARTAFPANFVHWPAIGADMAVRAPRVA